MNPEILRRLQSYEQEGKSLLNDINQALIQSSRKKDLGNIAADYLISEYLPSGTIRSSKKFAKGELFRRKQILENQTIELAEQWLNKIIRDLVNISNHTSKLTQKGNSNVLIRKFNSAKSAKQAQTKISRGLGALQQLQTYNLVYNNDLINILKNEKLQKAKTTKYKHLSNEAEKLLKKYPIELEALLGAIERFETGGLDAYRQSLSSCRNCIENLIKKRSGFNNMNEGLNILLKSETRKRTIKGTYNYLSAYGTHGKEIPNENDAKTGIEQTISVIRIITQ